MATEKPNLTKWMWHLSKGALVALQLLFGNSSLSYAKQQTGLDNVSLRVLSLVSSLPQNPTHLLEGDNLKTLVSAPRIVDRHNLSFLYLLALREANFPLYIKARVANSTIKDALGDKINQKVTHNLFKGTLNEETLIALRTINYSATKTILGFSELNNMNFVHKKDIEYLMQLANIKTKPTDGFFWVLLKDALSKRGVFDSAGVAFILDKLKALSQEYNDVDPFTIAQLRYALAQNMSVFAGEPSARLQKATQIHAQLLKTYWNKHIFTPDDTVLLVRHNEKWKNGNERFMPRQTRFKLAQITKEVIDIDTKKDSSWRKKYYLNQIAHNKSLTTVIFSAHGGKDAVYISSSKPDKFGNITDPGAIKLSAAEIADALIARAANFGPSYVENLKIISEACFGSDFAFNLAKLLEGSNLALPLILSTSKPGQTAWQTSSFVNIENLFHRTFGNTLLHSADSALNTIEQGGAILSSPTLMLGTHIDNKPNVTATFMLY